MGIHEASLLGPSHGLQSHVMGIGGDGPGRARSGLLLLAPGPEARLVVLRPPPGGHWHSGRSPFAAHQVGERGCHVTAQCPCERGKVAWQPAGLSLCRHQRRVQTRPCQIVRWGPDFSQGLGVCWVFVWPSSLFCAPRLVPLPPGAPPPRVLSWIASSILARWNPSQDGCPFLSVLLLNECRSLLCLSEVHLFPWQAQTQASLGFQMAKKKKRWLEPSLHCQDAWQPWPRPAVSVVPFQQTVEQGPEPMSRCQIPGQPLSSTAWETSGREVCPICDSALPCPSGTWWLAAMLGVRTWLDATPSPSPAQTKEGPGPRAGHRAATPRAPPCSGCVRWTPWLQRPGQSLPQPGHLHVGAAQHAQHQADDDMAR